MSIHKEFKKITTQSLQIMKSRGEKISMLTCYDYSMAKILDRSGIDVLLVGDSASNVIAGHETTLPITLDQMIYHAQCVVRGSERALVVVDLPFGSYQSNPEIALASAIRIMKETGAHAVKMEGGLEIIDSIKKIVGAGIPVMGHLGLTPQSIYQFGTYAVRAKEKEEADKLKIDIELLQNAGCFSIVLEKIPAELAREITNTSHVPIIGIGAGPDCDGQVLVVHDMLGLTNDFHPKFVRKYLNLEELMGNAVKRYIEDVKSSQFPNEKEGY